VEVKKIRCLEPDNLIETLKCASDCARPAPPKRGQFVGARENLENAHFAGRGDRLYPISLERGGQRLHKMLQRGAYTRYEEHALSTVGHG
jgi:hypothetical protein